MNEYRVWFESTDYRRGAGGRTGAGPSAVALQAARGGRASCRLVAGRIAGTEASYVDIEVESRPGIRVSAHRIGYVPLPHYTTDTDVADLCDFGPTPALVPDPLFDDTAAIVGARDEASYRIRIDVDEDAVPGACEIRCRVVSMSREAFDAVSAGGEADHDPDAVIAELTIHLRIHDLVLQPRNGLEATHWFYADTLHDWYGLDTFDEGYWRIVEPYMLDLRDHGIDVLYTPVFTAATDGERRPTQLLGIHASGGGYSFDFTKIDRYIELGKRSGFTKFEFPHLFSQWGAGKAIPLYEGNGAEEKRLFSAETSATGSEYRSFLSSLLPRLKEYLESKRLLENIRFHISDEPHGEEDMQRYIAARKLIGELAPWMKTMDAVSELSYGEHKLTDLPIPVVRGVDAYIAKGIKCGTYYCCNPRGAYVNRFLDTPIVRIRALGWLLYRFRANISMFLHWGYNYWYASQTRKLIDPFTVTDAGRWPGWTYGDPFVVYPGKSGPIGSIRWEAFAEGLEDYRLLQSAGMDPSAASLDALKGFDRFPRESGWYDARRGEAFGSYGKP